MNQRQVIILWAIAIGLGATVSAVKYSQNQAIQITTERKSGDTLFKSFPASETNFIEIKGFANSVTLVKKEGKWTVSERDGYPANATFVNDFIRTLSDLKVTQALEAGASFAPRFGMDETATTAEERGLTAIFKDGAGKEIAKVGLGKTISSNAAPAMPGMGGSSNAVGRYVRNAADPSGIYAVGEIFPSVSADPKRWLADGFINPEKIQSITAYLPDKTEVDWKLSRESDEAEFKLENATAAEVPATTATTPLKSLFSYARFEDIVPAERVAERSAPEGKRSYVIETTEGVTYKIAVIPSKPNTFVAVEPANPEAMPTPADNYLMTVDVSANLPKERKKPADEKPEDAKTADAAFAERQKTLSEKIAKEMAYSGITFEVLKSLVDPLLKDRKALTTKALPPITDDDGTQGNVQQLPGGMIARPPISATSPPIEASTPPIVVPGSEDGEGDVSEEDAPADEGDGMIIEEE